MIFEDFLVEDFLRITADLVTLTEETFNGKLRFLCSEAFLSSICKLFFPEFTVKRITLEVNWAFWGNLEIQGKTILIFEKVSWMNYSETLRALPSRHKGALSYREDTRITYRRSFWRSWQITCWSKLLPLTIYSKPAITRSKLTIETIGKGVEFIQS